MTAGEQINEIKLMLDEVIAEGPEYFLVSIRIKPTNNIKIYLDGDNGLPIEKCVYFNRKLYKRLEEKGLYPDGDFSLELSSPGIDEPLASARQYVKNVGRTVEVVFKDDTQKSGKLIQVSDAEIIIEETTGKGKKIITQQTVIPLDSIKTTTVQIQFK